MSAAPFPSSTSSGPGLDPEVRFRARSLLFSLLAWPSAVVGALMLAFALSEMSAGWRQFLTGLAISVVVGLPGAWWLWFHHRDKKAWRQYKVEVETLAAANAHLKGTPDEIWAVAPGAPPTRAKRHWPIPVAVIVVALVTIGFVSPSAEEAVGVAPAVDRAEAGRTVPSTASTTAPTSSAVASATAVPSAPPTSSPTDDAAAYGVADEDEIRERIRRERENRDSAGAVTAVPQVESPAPAPVPAPAPAPAPAPLLSQATPFKNCSAARAAGAAPVYRGSPGYGPHLDRDGDGIGCE